jgi:hypothetical protein
MSHVPERPSVPPLGEATSGLRYASIDRESRSGDVKTTSDVQ